MLETFMVRVEDMPDLAERVIQIMTEMNRPVATVLFLEGDLGAGKTTFTKELAGQLGINKEDVHSPTFILKKEYQTTHTQFRKLVHVDAYRFVSKDEGRVLHLEDDTAKPHTVIAIEWPSNMGGVKADVQMTFTVVDDDTREVGIAY